MKSSTAGWDPPPTSSQIPLPKPNKSKIHAEPRSASLLYLFLTGSCFSTMFHGSRANPWPVDPCWMEVQLTRCNFQGGDMAIGPQSFDLTLALLLSQSWWWWPASEAAENKAFQDTGGDLGPPGQLLLQILVLLMCLCCLLRSCNCEWICPLLDVRLVHLQGHLFFFL